MRDRVAFSAGLETDLGGKVELQHLGLRKGARYAIQDVMLVSPLLQRLQNQCHNVL